MALVPAKCTQCGANINIDNELEAAVCEHCGTPFIVEKAINNYNTTITNNNNFSGANINVVGADIDNLLELAEMAIEAKNGDEALEYSNRALEINPKSWKAWLIKMKTVEYSSTVGNTKNNEIIKYGNKAIEYNNNNEDVKIEVYKYYIKRATDLLMIGINSLKDTAKVKQLLAISPSGVAKGDTATRIMYLNLGSEALKLKREIPEKYIKQDNELQERIVILAKLYSSMCEADVERITLYGLKLNPAALEAREKTLVGFKEYLPEEKATEIKNDAVKKNNEGCYVATAVYGSYDCPQVWTLRRYRDNELAKTWYGRAFIRTYYTISPTIVKWFGETEWFKNMWRGKLDKMVDNLNANGVDNTPYNDIEW